MKVKPSVKEELEYVVEFKYDGDMVFTVTDNKGAQVTVTSDPLFGGLEEYLCPDELFVASIVGCIVFTFLFILRRMHVKVEDLRARGRSRLRLSRFGYIIEEVNIEIEVSSGECSKNRIIEALRLAEKYCHVTKCIDRSVTKINISYNVREL